MKQHLPAAAPLLRAALLFALLLPVRALALPPPDARWIEVRTPSFTLFSEAGETATRRVAGDLERLRDALSQLSPGLALDGSDPIWIYVFRNAASLAPYQRLYAGRPLASGGFFLSRAQGGYVAVNGDPRGNETAILYHEYIHSVARNNYGDLPLWLHEGLAEYYSTFEAHGGDGRLGLPVAEHVAWLRKNPLIPLDRLFAVDEGSPEYNEGKRRGDFYAESWALAHYLLAGPNPARRDQALEVLRLARGGMDGREAFRKVFGADPAPLERELRTYVHAYAFPSSRVSLKPEAEIAVSVRPLAPADVLFRLGDLLLSQGADHRAAAEEHLRAALKADPDHGPALAGLADLAALAGRAEEARGLYERAAKLAPDDFSVQYRYACSLMDDTEGREPSPEALRAARAALVRAVALRPGAGEAWARLGYTWQGEETMTEEAVRALETAHRLLPGRTDVAHNLALAYARTGHRREAEELIQSALAAQADPDVAADAREALLEEDYRRGEALAEAGKLEEAIPLLEGVRDRTRRTERRRALELRVDELRGALDFDRFVAEYNRAVELANHGDVKGALAILEPLARTARDPGQAERARTLLGRLQGAAKGKRPH